MNNHTRKNYEITTQVGISGFLERDDGKLSVSMYGEGVYVYDIKNKTLDSFTTKNNRIGSGIIEFLKPLNKSFAALTYSSGLTLVDQNNRSIFISKKEGLLSNSVYSVFQEKENE